MTNAYDARPWYAFYPANVRKTIEAIEFRNLADLCSLRAKQFSGRTAFTLCLPNGMGGGMSYAEVDRQSDAFALYLREVLGVRAGSRIALQSPNILSYPVVAFGIFKAGCVLVNVNPLYTAEEMGKMLADAKPECLVIIDMFADKLPQAMEHYKTPHVILISVTDFMTGFQKHLVGFVAKYVKKAIPPCKVPATSLQDALRQGEVRRAPGKVESYTASIGLHDIACLQYTGGTTGVSKGAMLTHGNLLFNMLQTYELMRNEYDDDKIEIIMTALPLYHIFAFTINFLSYWNIGAHNILIPSPRPLSNLKKAFEKFPITFMTGVNTLYNGLNHEDWFKAKPPAHLKNVSAGGMSMHVSVAEDFEKITSAKVVEGYGLTESSPVITFNPSHAIRLGSIGVPIPSTDVRIVDDNGKDVEQGVAGELIARGPQIMLGYWNRPDETAKTLKDGWLYTGDIAVMDKDGYFTIVDRKKDVVNVSGFNVYPNEIEDVLAKHPAIIEAAVIGVDDEHSGEVVKAFIVRTDPELTAADVRAYCREHLTGYKVPKIVEFRDDLPKSPVGKILRKDLRSTIEPH